jgi:pentapeptide MXKDX repeat protein
VGRQSSPFVSEAFSKESTMKHGNRAVLVISAATLSLGLVFTPAAFAQDSKDTMGKDSMTKDTMSKDKMSKDSMSKDSMSKDSMSKDSMKKDEIKK